MKNSKILGKEDPIRLPYFDWDKAKYFYYVAKLGSFSEGGKFLNISQPSLSRKISILESHLKCKLFTRVPKGLELTRKGEQLFAIIEQTFLELKGFAYEAAVTTDNGQKRKIRISTTHALADYIISDLIFDYNKDHPYIVFDLIGEDHLLDVLINDVDITLHAIDPRIKVNPDKQGLKKDYLHSFEKKLYASKAYLEKYGEPQTIEDLKEHRLIAFSHPEKHPYGDVNWILSLGMSAGQFHNPIFTSNSAESLIKAAIQGLGIISSYDEFSILRSAHLKNILPDVKCKPLELYFIYPEILQKDQEIMEIKNYFQQRLASKDSYQT